MPWIDHDGSPRPVERETLIQARLRDGYTTGRMPAGAFTQREWFWQFNEPFAGDVMGFCVYEPAPK